MLITLIFVPFYSELHWGRILNGVLLNGTLTVVLGIVNGMIADGVKISWLEQPLKRFVVSFVLTIVFTLIVAALVQIVLTWLFFGTSPQVVLNNLSKDYYYNVLMITLVISTFLHGRGFLLEWRNSIEETEALKRAHLTSQYESLKKQVNPHFLFNSLNVLTALVHKDADLSEKFIRQLSDVYRYVLEVSEQELVGLDRELRALEAYVFLLQIRFGDNLRVEVNIPDAAQQLIPPLALQMLVENAVKHNVISREDPLVIKVVMENERIVVENNLQKKDQQPFHLGIGLKNIKKRYQKYVDEKVRVEEKEYFFRVSLPQLPLQPERPNT